MALFFLYPHWLLTWMAPFPALVFILWQALPSAVGLPTQITLELLVEHGWRGGLRASRLPHSCSGDSPSNLICSSPIEKENPLCCLSTSSLGMVPVCRRTTPTILTTDKGSLIRNHYLISLAHFSFAMQKPFWQKMTGFFFFFPGAAFSSTLPSPFW